MTDFWVFGYGSLIWRPGFAYLEAAPARLYGAHRALCVYSWVHRGTEAEPGLVLGLDRGGSCRGLAFRVAAEEADGVRSYLREREQVTMVYREALYPVRIEGNGDRVQALTYAVDRSHPQYAGAVPPDVALAIVRSRQGVAGANRDYVINTARHLAELGMADAALDWLAARLETAEGGPLAIAGPTAASGSEAARS
jgi:cation transport protein ChaC